VESVPLSEENQTWVREEIRAAINPNGWKKTANWLRYWGLTSVCITAFLALVGIVITLGIFAANRIGQESEFRGTTTTRLSAIESRLVTIESSLLALRTSRAADAPANKENIAEAKEILKDARQNKVLISSDVVKQSGNNFIDAALREPAAWDTVLDFLNYRAYLNSVTVPLGQQVPVKDFSTHYQIPMENMPTIESMETIGVSKLPDVAQIGALSAPNLNKNLAAGASLILLDAPTVVLDGLYAKKVVFRNSHIIYRGGPVVLDNVYFLDCTFEIKNQTKGQEFARIILSGPSTNFMSS